MSSLMDGGQRQARAGLAMACAGTADRQLAALVDVHGASEVWAGLLRGGDDSRWSVRARRVQLAEVAADTERHGLRFLIPGDQEWPDCLNDLDHAEVGGMGGRPFGLWVKGPARLDQLAAAAVAIVGSRAASHYGEWAAGQIAAEIAQQDLSPQLPVDAHSTDRAMTVISGGAYGIDAAAHRGALTVGGRTLAVLAGGLDEVYPRGNARLIESISDEGLLVSEIGPGLSPTRVAFLARNRLIAALSTVTVIVEAAARSGAQNTVAWAQSLGRVVAAVPGPISSDRSLTPHRLIREAEAVLVTCGREVADLAGSMSQPASSQPVSSLAASSLAASSGVADELDGLEPELREVRETLRRRGGTPLDEVVARSGLRPGVALARLGELEQQGWVRLRSDGAWGLAQRR